MDRIAQGLRHVANQIRKAYTREFSLIGYFKKDTIELECRVEIAREGDHVSPGDLAEQERYQKAMTQLAKAIAVGINDYKNEQGQTADCDGYSWIGGNRLENGKLWVIGRATVKAKDAKLNWITYEPICERVAKEHRWGKFEARPA